MLFFGLWLFGILCVLNGVEAFNVTHMIDLIGQNCSAKLGIPIVESTLVDVAITEEVDITTSDRTECPPWFIGDQNGRLCRTGPNLDGLLQQDKETLQTQLLECNCMTVTPDNRSLAVGACLYTCNAINGYFPLPCNTSHLNHYMCSDLNRKGQLCGECKEGFAPPAYSYDMKCTWCKHYHYNWLKYLVVAFLPLTVFYVIVAAFSISFTSPLISSTVLVYQFVVSELQMVIVTSLMESGLLIIDRKTVTGMTSLAGVWSLDFFRLAYDPFCLHPHMTTLQTLALDYAIAVYPLLLIMLTYILIRLHMSRCRPIVWIWKPFGCLLGYFRKRSNIKTSLIDVFASFIFLSTSRVQMASYSFLIPTHVHTLSITDNVTQPTMKLYLLFAPTVEYFGRQHLPFAMLALVLLLALGLLPMILLFVYPFRCFQKLLNRYNLNSHVLRTFMDVFQGSFKDGTEGTHDYRSFSALLLLPGMVLWLLFSLTRSSYYYPIASIFIAIYWGLFIIFQPFRRQLHNYITIAMVVAFLCAYLGLTMNIQAVAGFSWTLVADKKRLFHVSMVISTVLIVTGMSIPITYVVMLVIALVCTRIDFRRRFHCCNK